MLEGKFNRKIIEIEAYTVKPALVTTSIELVKPALVTTSIELVKPALVTTSIELQSTLI